ncbi:hypothetical protein GE061_016336 [Apolygus lucorum]|uniref:Glutathione S-transferase n=1 Tax=Apolygus lucorum TaxID=248454 RepID=A0A6A4K4K8_APOLU|nr:hypothetical protein GE061_016336 [Apolygus lucorum]
MPKYKLTYFDAKGIGEGIRMILSFMGADWEEVRVEFPHSPTSPWQKMKADVKYYKLPILEIDGTFTDFVVALQQAYHQRKEPGLNEAEKAETMKPLIEEAIPHYFKIYDDSIKENNGYLAIGKLTWVDFYVIGFIDTIHVVTGVKIFDEYHNLNALKNKIYSIENIKKWIDQQP